MKSTLDKRTIPLKDIFYFRQRLKNKIFQSTLACFASAAKERDLTKKDIANLLDKDPAQITRWFSGPNNWTLDTISDLLLAIGAELKHEIVPLHVTEHQINNSGEIEESLEEICELSVRRFLNGTNVQNSSQQKISDHAAVHSAGSQGQTIDRSGAAAELGLYTKPGDHQTNSSNCVAIH